MRRLSAKNLRSPADKLGRYDQSYKI